MVCPSGYDPQYIVLPVTRSSCPGRQKHCIERSEEQRYQIRSLTHLAVKVSGYPDPLANCY